MMTGATILQFGHLLSIEVQPGVVFQIMNDVAIDSGQRGPAEHAVRDQIVEAANECFARYGYAKTTVADLAREIGFSKAYIYKFFDSKQAIGEAICSADA